MINLEYTEKSGLGYRHRTWTKIGEEHHQPSPLQNQFALSEYGLSEDAALARFRVWLWEEMKDKYNVVGKQMQQLARSHLEGQEVDVLVPKDAPHGQIIIKALLWLASNCPPAPLPRVKTAEPAPCYEPIIPDGNISTRAEIDSKHIVWVQGNTSSRIGVIVGYNEVFVPDYGILPLKKFHWANAKLAASPLLQERLNDELDSLFEKEADGALVEYESEPPYNSQERYDEVEGFWEQTVEEEINQQSALATASRDSMTQLEELAAEFGDMETAFEVAGIPDVEGWYYKRPPTPSYCELSTIRTVYKYTGEDKPLMVKSPVDQVANKRFRYATREETQEYRRKFRSGK